MATPSPAAVTLSPEAQPALTSLAPQRFADTRPGEQTIDSRFAGAGRRAPRSTYEVQIAGRGNVPAGASGAIMNIAAVDPSGPGFFTVFPCGTLPTASALNYLARVTIANEVVAALSPAGTVCVYTLAESDVLIDVVGYTKPTDSIKTLSPKRYADSRVGESTFDGQSQGFGRAAAGSTTKVRIGGRGAVPASAAAAIINVAVVDPNGPGFLTVHACLPTLPVASSINHIADVNRANELIAELDANGDVCIYTKDDVHMIVDVVGFVEADSDLVSIANARYAETRDGEKTFDGVLQGGGKLAAGSTTVIPIAGRGAVPAGAAAVVTNIAAVDPDGPGFFTFYPCNVDRPTASSINYTARVTGANEIVARLDAGGRLCLYTSTSSHFILDVVGYVKPNADLSITKNDNVTAVIFDDTITYTIKVDNDGPDTARSVKVSDTLPSKVTFVKTTGCAQSPAGLSTCSLGNIAPGASASYTITGKIQRTIGTVENSAAVTSATGDPDLSNNSTNEVTEVNQVAPIIVSNGGGNTASRTIAENRTVVANVQSTDHEGDVEGAGLTYSLTTAAGGGEDNARFSIDANTGVLSFVPKPNFENPLDRDTDNVYKVQVRVTDSTSLTDRQDITVRVTNVNEAPVIFSPTEPVYVPEGTIAVTDVGASDVDLEHEEGNGLTFSKTTAAAGGADNARFILNPVTGVVRFVSAPDFEAPVDANRDNTYALQVTVTDDGGLTDVQNIAVIVTNGNEAPTIVTNGGSTEAPLEVPENTTAVIDIDTDDDSDSDGAGLSYALAPTPATFDNEFFAVDNFGVLTFIAPGPDFENPADANANNVYLAQVMVTDSGGLTDVLNVVVKVLDVKDIGPIAVNDGFNGLEDATLEVAAPGVLGNDSDVEGDAITVVLPSTTTSSQGGTVVLAADGSFTYAPVANFFGTDTFQYQAIDAGGSNMPSDIATVTITVANVNDAPSFTADEAPVVVAEDAGATTVAGWATDISAGPGETQGLTFVVTGNSNSGLFSVAPTVNPTSGNLTFTAAANANGSAVVTLQLVDNGGTANDGVDASAVFVLQIDVTAVNDAPSFTKGSTATVNEDSGPYTELEWATDISVGPADESDQTPSFNVTAMNTSLFSTQPAIDADGTLTFTPAANATGVTTVTVSISDDGGTANVGDVDTSRLKSFQINIIGVNDVPVAVADAYSVTEGGTLTAPGESIPAVQDNDTDIEDGTPSGDVTLVTPPSHHVGLFVLDPDGSFTYNHDGSETPDTDTFRYRVTDSAGAFSNVATVTITILPFNETPTAVADAYSVDEDTRLAVALPGVLGNDTDPENDALSVVLPSTIASTEGGVVALSADGSFTYDPPANFFGSDTFSYAAIDAAGSNTASNNATVTITVNAVNDAPSFVAGASPVTVLEDSGVYSAPWATTISAGALETQTVAFAVTNNTNAGLFASGPAVSPSGVLSFTPAANANGTATISIVLIDNGGTANDGVDTSTSVNFDIAVTAVNDEPSFTKGSNVTVAEDSGDYTELGWATAISVGPADESAQIPTFVVTAANTALFSTQPAVNAAGELTFTPAANANGSSFVQLLVTDNGGTDNGGDNQSSLQSFYINVTAVNDVPVAVADGYTVVEGDTLTIPSGALVGVRNNDTDVEDVVPTGDVALVRPPAHNVGAFVLNSDGSFVYTHDGSESPTTDTFTYRVTDSSGAYSNVATVTITITPFNETPTAVADAYSVNEDTSLEVALPGVLGNDTDPENDTLTVVLPSTIASTEGGIVALSADGSFTYDAPEDFFGTDTFAYAAIDAAGSNTASNNATVTITVNAVNDEPSFTLAASPNQTVAEDSGAQTAADLVTASDAGAPNESTQTLTLTVTNNNNALFSAQPAIDLATGELSYTPAANANGTATVAVRISDNGGTANGGDDTSPDQTFTITVTAVNDAPSFAKGGDITVSEDSGAYGPTAWATALSAGPANESTQTLSFDVTAANASLFSVQPTVSPTGQISFTPAPSANGSTLVTVSVTDNGGLPGVDTSPDQTFEIIITPVNDAPVVTATTPLAEYIEGDGAVAIDAGPDSFTVSDIDSTFLVGVTVQITDGAESGVDQLACPACGPLGLNAAFSPVTNRLTISGPDSVADYQTALQSVTFENASDTPSGADRELTIIANDGLDASVPAVMTFTFVVTGDIVIIKDAIPNHAQDFEFTEDITGGEFSLDDDGNAFNTLSNTQTFNNVRPGTYSVTEALAEGWDLTALNCSDVDSTGDTLTRTATINVAAGETVTCTFTNDNRGTITVVNDTDPDADQDFSFAHDIVADPVVASPIALDDDADGTVPNAQIFENVAPGVYTVTETPVAGWDISNIECSGESSTFNYLGATAGATEGFETGDTYAEITLGFGDDTVSCTFTNTEQGTISIVKDTIGADAAFDFTDDVEAPNTFNLDTADVFTKTFAGVVPGTYTVRELVPANGWDLTNIECVSTATPASTFTYAGATVNPTAGYQRGDNRVTITLAPGDDTVSCTFTNTERGTITVDKATIGGDGTFTFTGSANGSAASLDLTTVANFATETLTEVPGEKVYTITESAQTGWDITGIVCDNDGGTSTFEYSATGVTMTLAAGDDIDCDFENTKRGTIEIVKDTVGGDGEFAFTDDTVGDPLGDFAIDTDESDTQMFENVLPGTYLVTETAQTGWDLTDLTCVDVGDGGSSDLLATATIDLDPGETVTCTFENTKRGTIEIVKNTVGSDGTFGFTGDLDEFDITTVESTATATFENVLTGTYDVTEDDPTTGYDLTGLECLDSDETGTVSSANTETRTGTINLDPGETVTCTFDNTERGTIEIVKTTVGGNEEFDFTDDTVDTPLGDFSITTVLGTATQTFADVLAGTYAITEIAETNWDLTDLVCVDPDDESTVLDATVTIDLDPGETVTCTYTNTQRGSIHGLEFIDNDGNGLLDAAAPAIQIIDSAGDGVNALDFPNDGIAADGSGNVFVAGRDSNNVFKVTPGGVVTQVLDGSGDGVLNALTTPNDVAVDAAGNVFVTGRDSDNVFRVTPGGVVTAIATSIDGIDFPWGIATDAAGNVFVAGRDSDNVIKITPGGVITEILDGTGDGSNSFDGPAQGIATDTAGNVYVSAELSDNAFKVTPGGAITQIIDSAGDGSNSFDRPRGLAVDVDGNVFVAGISTNNVFKVTPGGAISQIIDSSGDGSSPLSVPIDLATDAAGNVFVASEGSNNVFVITPSGAIAEIIDLTGDGANPLNDARALAIDGAGNIFVTGPGSDNVFKVDLGELSESGVEITLEGGDLVAPVVTNTDATGEFHFDGLTAGTYTVTQTVPAGYTPTTLTSVEVTVSPGEEEVAYSGQADLAPSQTETVNTDLIFGNAPNGTIEIVADSDPDDAQDFDFTENVTLDGDFTLVDDGGAGNLETFLDVPFGTYTVTETPVPDGWDLTGIDCVDPDSGSSGGLGSASIDLDPGETVTCTFTNTKDAFIVVDKVTDPTGDPAEFDFDASWIGDLGSNDFQLADESDVFNSGDLDPGTYSVAELAEAGWDLTDTSCDSVDGDGNAGTVAAIDLDAGETVTCTFTNTKRGAIDVTKTAVNGDGTFDFTGDLGAFDVATVAGTATQPFPDVAPGTYTISETAQIGWDLADIECTSTGGSTFTYTGFNADPAFQQGDTSVNVTLAPGDASVSCEFTNVAQGTILLAEDTVPNSGQDFSFAHNIVSAPLVGSPVILDDDADGVRSNKQTFQSVVPGIYTITETPVATWDLTTIECIGTATFTYGANSATINFLAPTSTASCEFTNVERGALRVNQSTQTLPINGQNFAYTVTNPSAAQTAFQLDDDANLALPNFRNFPNVVPGNYVIAQANEAGWDLIGIVCTSTAGSTFTYTGAFGGTPGFEPGDHTANVALAPGDRSVACTFTNDDKGTIDIAQNALGDSDYAFEFTETITTPLPGATFTRDGNGVTTFSDVIPGIYSVTQTVPASGWDLTDIVCTTDDFTAFRYYGGDDSGTNEEFEPGDTQVTIDLAGADDTVSCEFENTERGTITITKAAVGDDGTFNFIDNVEAPNAFAIDTADTSVKSFVDVLNGTYTITEEVPESGWDLTAIECTDNDGTSGILMGADSVDIALAPGDDVDCTFTNTKRGMIDIAATTVGDDGEFTFTDDVEAPNTFIIDTAVAATNNFTEVPGDVTYTVTESAQIGWDVTNIVCPAVGTSSFEILGAADGTSGFEAGDTYVEITLSAGDAVGCSFENTQRGTIVIDKISVGDDGGFEFTGDMGAFDIATEEGDGGTTFENVVPGTYDVTETAQTGWDLTALTCVDPDDESTGAFNTATIDLDPGETVTCTFTNTKRGTIEIVKTAVGGDDVFAFTDDIADDTPSSGFSLTTEEGTATETFTEVLPGTYTVSETLVATGWDLTALECTDSDRTGGVSSGDHLTGIASVDLDPGETVTCTFTNTADAFIVIDKVTDPAEDPAVFSFGASWLDDDFQLADDADAFNSGDLDPGTYSVIERGQEHWDLTDSTCESSIGDEESADDIELDAGETVTCTFTNTKRGTLAISTNSDPEGPQDFTFSAGTGGASSIDVPVDEVEPNDSIAGAQNLDAAGWNLVFSPDIGDSTTNTSTVIPHISILGTGNETFDYYSFTVENAGDIGIFDIDYGAGGAGSMDAYLNLFDGAGAALDSNDDSSTSNGQSGSSSVLDSYIEYTFGAPGVYVIRVGRCCVSEVPTGGGYTLQVSLENASGGTAFVLDDDGETVDSPDTQTFPNVEAGVDFIVSQTPVSGWDLTDIVCSGAVGTTFDINGNVGTDTAAFEPGDTAVIVNFTPGDETASCEFTNTERGTIVIAKTAVGGDDTFSFSEDITETGSFDLTTEEGSDSATFEEVLPGTYVVAETDLPESWNLTNLVCVSANTASTVSLTGSNVDTTDYELGDDTATIGLAPGDTVTCTFTNTDERGSIEIVKDAEGASGRFTFDETITLDSFDLVVFDEDETASASFNDINPGTYFVTETQMPGWELRNIECTSERGISTFVYSGARTRPTVRFEPGDHTVRITLRAGDDDVSCTFTNVDVRGEIEIVQDSTPNDAQVFEYTENILGEGTTNLFDDGSGDDNSRTFGDVLPGATYSVTQTQVAGWELTGIECTSTGGSTFAYSGATAEIALAPEDTDVSCTFTNTDVRGTIIIVEDANPNSAQNFSFTQNVDIAGPFVLDDDADAVGEDSTYTNTRTFENVVPGTYTVVQGLVAGWVVSGLNCDDPGSTGSNGGTRTATIDLDASETITCVFTNTPTPG